LTLLYIKMDNHFLQNFGVKNPIVLDMVKKNMINLNYDRNFIQFRKLRDETTKHFTDVFVKNGPTYNFINYIYHKMNTYIISNINSEIIKYNQIADCEDQPFLSDDEEILFIFKGGTNMFLLKKHMDSQINNDLEEVLRVRAREEYIRLRPANKTENEFINEKIIEYKDSFNNNFDISDSDFTLYIICKDEKRYAFLYNIVSKLLITILEEISLEMDNKINELEMNVENVASTNNRRIIPPNPEFSPQILNFDNGIVEDSLTNYYYEYKRMYKGLFLNIFNNGINKITLVTEFINIINEKLVNPEFTDLAKLSLIKNTLTLIKYICNQNHLNINIDIINNLITRVNTRITEELTANLVRINDLYSIEKFIDFKRRLVTGLNNSTRKNGRLIIFNDHQKSKNQLTGYRIVGNIDYEDIQLKKRNSVLLKNKNVLCRNIGFEIINGTQKKRHYTSVNNEVFTNISKAGHIVAFDLYRVKLNVILKNSLKNGQYLIESTNPSNEIKVFRNEDFINHPESINIPTEFIDVSIAKFNDFNLVNEREKYYDPENQHTIYEHFDIINVNPIENPNIVMKSILFYSYEALLEDLNIVLFKQNTFTCLFDSKFTKRMFRYLYFYLILLLRKAIEARTLPMVEYIDTLDQIQSNISNITQLFEKIANYPNHNANHLLEYFEPLYKNDHFNFISNPIMPQLISNNLINRNISEYFKVKDSYKNIESLINHHFVFKTLIPQQDINNRLRTTLLNFLNNHLNYYNIIGYQGYENQFVRDLYKLFDEEVIILKNISAYISDSLIDFDSLSVAMGFAGGYKSLNTISSKSNLQNFNHHIFKLLKEKKMKEKKMKEKIKTNSKNKGNKNKDSRKLNISIINSIIQLKNFKNPVIKMNVSNISSPIIMNVTSLGGNKKLNEYFRKCVREGLKRDKNKLNNFGMIDDNEEVSNGNIIIK
jgi:hypothetical protein